LEKVFDGTTDKGYHYSANNYTAAEHGGTHMDAPIHFKAGGLTVDQLPLSKTTGFAVVVDVTKQTLNQRDYEVGVSDFLDFEAKNGPIEKDQIILIATGFDRFWPDAKGYLGTAERGTEAIAKLHFPGLSPKAAEWLVRERGIRAVGIDTASIDFGQSHLFESHQIFADAGVPIFENLKGLQGLKAKGVFFIGLPMKIKDGSGAPLRAMALLPDA
jgi:kynurenine formamidase